MVRSGSSQWNQRQCAPFRVIGPDARFVSGRLQVMVASGRDCHRRQQSVRLMRFRTKVREPDWPRRKISSTCSSSI